MGFYGVAPVRFGGISMVTASLGDNDPEVGTECQHAGENYRFVYNAGNSAIKPGFAATVSGLAGYSCTVSTTTSVDFIVGVCKHATLSTGTYGWLLTKGFTKVVMAADNSCAAGQLLTVAADGEFALKSNSTGYPAPAFGKAVSAIASAGSGMAYITCY